MEKITSKVSSQEFSLVILWTFLNQYENLPMFLTWLKCPIIKVTNISFLE